MKTQTIALWWLALMIVWGGAMGWPGILAAKGNDGFGAKLGTINVQNRAHDEQTPPLYGELNYHLSLINNPGYDLIVQAGYGDFTFQRRERGLKLEHRQYVTVMEVSFVNNERDGFELYWGAGGGGGYFQRRSEVIKGTLEGEKGPSTSGAFISYHVAFGTGWYSGGTGGSLDFKYANWGGLLVVLGTLEFTF